MTQKFKSGFGRSGRRQFLTGITALAVGGCDRIAENDTVVNVIGKAGDLSMRVQRLMMGNRLAPEYPENMIAANFKANGSTDPQNKEYLAIKRNNFASWRLGVGGLVDRPASLSLADLRKMPSRTQITRHDCVEGWSCIGKWKGAPLANILQDAGVKAAARYVVFHCADDMNEQDEGDESAANVKAGKTMDASKNLYYESIDLVDAMHAQTILAYDMNDKPLAVPHGAPLRVRIERQLGYKMAKYILRIELVASLDAIGEGKGGYWPDRGYDWYAGI